MNMMWASLLLWFYYYWCSSNHSSIILVTLQEERLRTSPDLMYNVKINLHTYCTAGLGAPATIHLQIILYAKTRYTSNVWWMIGFIDFCSHRTIVHTTDKYTYQPGPLYYAICQAIWCYCNLHNNVDMKYSMLTSFTTEFWARIFGFYDQINVKITYKDDDVLITVMQ